MPGEHARCQEREPGNGTQGSRSQPAEVVKRAAASLHRGRAVVGLSHEHQLVARPGMRVGQREEQFVPCLPQQELQVDLQAC